MKLNETDKNINCYNFYQFFVKFTVLCDKYIEFTIN